MRPRSFQRCEMKESPNDTWFLIRNFPRIAREGLRLVTDEPYVPELRVDPDGERKREERVRARRSRRHGGTPLADVVPISRPPPKTKTIHLQWLDRSYDPVWRDTAIEIGLEKPSIASAEGWLLGHVRHGSGALGVFVIALPAIIVLSPYVFAKNSRWRARERKEGMSRHAIALMRRLEGQLDAATADLLRRALKNEWAHERKMTRRVSFDEACALLDGCAMTEHRSEPVEGDALRKDLLQEFLWRDGEGDLVGHVQLVDGRLHSVRILGSEFEEEQVRILVGRFRTRQEIDIEDI